MPVQGEYLQKNGRRYVAYNPDEFTGPFSWRLSMLPGNPVPAEITSIFTILPIDSVSLPSGDMNLFFNIEGLEDVSTVVAAYATGWNAAKVLLSLNSTKNRTLYGLENLTAEPPVQAARVGSQVAIYFNIAALPTLELSKSRDYVRANDYNSTSIDKLTADKPLFVTSSEDHNALVNFDISSLDLA